MANNIKGISIEIGGDTTPLQKALKDVNSSGKSLNDELKQINRQLDFNPGNADLIAQKQKVLAEATANTGEKLSLVREAYRQMQEAMANGADVPQEKQRALQRELLLTEQQYSKSADAAATFARDLESQSTSTERAAAATRGLEERLGTIDKLLKFDPTNTELLAQKQEALAEKVGQSKDALEELRTADASMRDQMSAGAVSAEQYDDFRLTLAEAEIEYRKNEKALQGVTGQVEDVGDAAEQSSGKLDGLSGVLSKISEVFGINLPPQITSAVQGFEKAKSSGAELGSAVGDLAQNMGVNLPPGVSKAISGMGGFTAAAVAAAAAAALVVKALIDLAKNGASAADEMATNVSVMGVTAERYQELAYMSELVDTSTQTMGSSMSKLTQSMSNAANGADKQQKAFARLKVEYQNTNGTLKSNQEVFYDVIDALGEVGNQTERDALAMELFGKSARELNPLIAAGGDEMRRLAQEAHDVGAVMSQDVLDAYLALSDEMDRSKSISEGLKNTLGSIMTPALTQAFQAFNDIVAKISKGFQDSQMVDALKTMFSMIGSIIEILGDVLEPVLAGIFAYLEKLYAIVNFILAPVNMLLTSIKLLIQLMTGKISKVEFLDELNNAGEKALTTWGKSVDSIIGKNDDLQKSAKETGGVIGDSISSGYATGAAAAEKEYMTLEEVNEKIKQSREDAKKAAASYYTTVADASGNLSRVHKKDYELYEKYASYIDTHYAGLSEKERIYKAKQLEQQSSTDAQLRSALTGRWSEAARDLQKAGHDTGENVMLGVADGINDNLPPVQKALQGVVTLIKSAFTDGLDIQSPSREGYKWGAYTLEGYVNGFQSVNNRLKTSIANSVGIVREGLGSSPAKAATGGTTYQVSVYAQAKNLHEMQDVLDMAKRAKQDYRAGRR